MYMINKIQGKTLFIYISLLAVLLSSTALNAQNFGFQMVSHKKKVKVAFTEYNNLIIIPMKVNGLPMNFVLDTGVRYTILVQKVYSDILNLKYSREIKLIGADRNYEMRAFVCDNVSLSVDMGDIYNSKESIVVLEEDYLQFEEFFGADVQGIIGYDIFKKFIVKIDYDTKIVTFQRRENFKPPRKYKEFGMNVEFTKAYINTIVKQQNKDTLHCKLLIDSGASFPLLLDLEADERIVSPPKRIEGDMGRGLSGTMAGTISRVEQISVGDFEFNRVVTFYQTDERFNDVVKLTGRHGILGGDVLSRFKVILDFTGERMWLKPGASFKKTFKYNMSGIVLKDEAPDWPIFKVVKVIKDSPAYEAGLQEGDFITKVNSLSGELLTIHRVREIFKSKAGRKIKLTYMRNGEVRQAKFILRELI